LGNQANHRSPPPSLRVVSPSARLFTEFQRVSSSSNPVAKNTSVFHSDRRALQLQYPGQKASDRDCHRHAKCHPRPSGLSIVHYDLFCDQSGRSKEPFRAIRAGRRLRPATVCLLQHIQVPSGRKIYKSVLRVRLFFHPPSAIDITYERSFEFGAKKREWAQIGSLGLAVQPLRLFSLRAPQRIRVLSDRTLQNRIKRKKMRRNA
jgi:hypothetical protein